MLPLIKALFISLSANDMTESLKECISDGQGYREGIDHIMFHQKKKRASFGCFQIIASGLLGLGIYLATSLGTCLIVGSVVKSFYPDPYPFTYPNFPSGELIKAMLGVLAFSFLCVGPGNVAIYVRYLLSRRRANPQDFASPEPGEKRKRF